MSEKFCTLAEGIVVQEVQTLMEKQLHNSSQANQIIHTGTMLELYLITVRKETFLFVKMVKSFIDSLPILYNTLAYFHSRL